MPVSNIKVRWLFLTASTVVAAALILSAPWAGEVLAQGGGGGAVDGPTFKVLRSMAGSSGTEVNGRLAIDDPRTVFYLGQDHKIIVYFEWEGPPAQHKFEGIWKNTDSKVTLISDFQYVAPGKQFSGYWTMLLSGSEAPGLWTLEAHIDGESAGELSFQLIAGPGVVAPVTSGPPPRQPLSTGDLYKRLAEVSVYVDKIDAKGKAVMRGSGFYLDDGQLITAFQNVDGATKLRVISADGTAQEATAVRSWDRWKDWAILAISGTKVKGLSRAAPKSWAVGSECYFLQTSSGSGRVIADGTVVGQNTFPRAGERLNIAESPSRGSIGSPLTNEFGDVVGMVGGSLAPGTDLLGSYLLASASNSLGANSYVRDGLAVPINLVPAVASQDPPTSLEELTRKGQMVPLLNSEQKVIFGELALTLEKGRGMPAPTNSGQQFSHRDQKIWVYINWNENLPFKGTAAMAVYDADNRALGQSNPLKVTLRSGSLSSSTWEIPLMSLSPGIYRVDVSLGDEIVWRKFFRMTD
jgi:S1-C subfamily serine protease